MGRYIIEIDDGKIFSYAAAGLRLMKPHGDKFYSAGNFSAYWAWFAEEIAADELDICFIYSGEPTTIEQIKAAALKFPHAENSTWQMAELRKFFTKYRDEPLKENFHWDENLRQIIFDDGKIFKVDGLSNLILEPEKISEPPKKFKIRVITPSKEKVLPEVEPKKITKHEKLPLELPTEFQEKISASDLQKYIAEQTNGQCDKVSFKS